MATTHPFDILVLENEGGGCEVGSTIDGHCGDERQNLAVKRQRE